MSCVISSPCYVNVLKKEWVFSHNPLKKWRDERLSKIAEEWAQTLRHEPRQSIKLALKNPKMLAARQFLKHLKVQDQRVEACRKELTAFKLGIEADTLNCNPGFQKFAEDHHIERYLMEYGHTLSVEHDSRKLSILQNGHLITWDRAQKVFCKLSR